MPNPTFYSTDGEWENAADVQTMTVYIADPTADDRITLFRAYSAGRVIAARWHPDATLAAGTANYYTMAIHNGGTFAAGTAQTVVCAAVGGTTAGGTAPGWTADTDTDLPVTGTATFAASEAIVLDYQETGTVAPTGRLQISFRYDV